MFEPFVLQRKPEQLSADNAALPQFEFSANNAAVRGRPAGPAIELTGSTGSLKSLTASNLRASQG
ncbi:hypothetical protein A5692_07875 [Mycobacterium sp. E342]|nr:hypothetical protein A5692_07875 [Mycobacterium sp. E342]